MLRVFLVEDEIVIREAIHKMIPWNEYGYELVGEATDGEMALPMVRDSLPDVIITDIKMPFMDGLAFSRLVRQEMPKVKIIIISGYDDFTYAQEAISLGVEQYLLKPISKAKLIEVLIQVRDKYEKENEQKVYYEKFHREIQEYEKASRSEYFEKLVTGQYELQECLEQARLLKLDILAERYNIVLFAINGETYSTATADVIEKVNDYLQEQKEYLLFRNQLYSYAVLVKGKEGEIEDVTMTCTTHLTKLFSELGQNNDWFLCTGKVVGRLSQLKESYKVAMDAYVLRYMEQAHVITYEKKEGKQPLDFGNIDINTVGQEVIQKFLAGALEDEIDSFITNYIMLIGEKALKSKLFCQYILLNAYFSAVAFVQKLGYGKEALKQTLSEITYNQSESIEQLRSILGKILAQGIRCRDESVKRRYSSVITKVLDFLKEHYMEDTLTLNKAASVANISANHFSAMFSKEMDMTFIEYLTDLRMNQAKVLLRCTDKRSGEIALEIGYKDPHYFSFLFKKTQGCTPSEYRTKKGSRYEKKK